MRSHGRMRLSLVGALIAAVAVAAVAIMGRGQTTPVDAGSGTGIVGSWEVTVDGRAPSQLITFTADGSVLFSSGVAYQVPPQVGLGVTRVFSSAGHGTWARMGERRYAGRFIAMLFDDDGRLVITFTSDFTLTLNSDGDSFSVAAQH